MGDISCPRCGTQNPKQYMNCWNCGTKLAFALSHPAEIEDLRRQDRGLPAKTKSYNLQSEVDMAEHMAGDWQCHFCFAINEPWREFCMACLRTRQPGHPVDDEAETLFNKAISIKEEILDKADLSSDEVVKGHVDDINRVMSYFRAAYDKADRRHARAAAMISYWAMLLKDRDTARRYAVAALNLVPNNFTARLVLLGLAEQELLAYEPRIDSSSWVGLGISVLTSRSGVSGRKSKLQAAASDLVVSFRHWFDRSVEGPRPASEEDVKYVLDLAYALVTLGETLRAYGMDHRPTLQAVLDAKWDELVSPSVEAAEKVEDLLIRAQGQLAL